MTGETFLFFLSLMWFYMAYKTNHPSDKITKYFLIILGTLFLLGSIFYK
jgi:hypothetical protein